MSNDAKRALWCCLLTALVGLGMLAWSTTVEEQFQSLVFGAGLVAMLAGAVLGVGIVLASLWEG